MQIINYSRAHVSTSVATGLGYPGHLGHFLSGQSGFHPDILICLTWVKLSYALKTAMKRLILSNRAVTNISRIRS